MVYLKSALHLQTGTLLSLPRATLPKLQSPTQPRDRAGLLSKQSAHTDPNLIRIRKPDTRY